MRKPTLIDWAQVAADDFWPVFLSPSPLKNDHGQDIGFIVDDNGCAIVLSPAIIPERRPQAIQHALKLLAEGRPTGFLEFAPVSQDDFWPVVLAPEPLIGRDGREVGSQVWTKRKLILISPNVSEAERGRAIATALNLLMEASRKGDAR